MSGYDLKITTKEAADEINRLVLDAAKDIDRRGNEMIRLLAEANSTAAKPDMVSAEIAAVIELDVPFDLAAGMDLMLAVAGQFGGQARIFRPIRRGSFRALVLIERLDDKKPE